MPPHAEKICQLCSIPFAIGRIRTVHEPLSAGWDPTGSPYHLRDASSSLCSIYPSESGCQNVVVRSPPNLHAESRTQHLAGPGCTFLGGYSGHRIGEREMRGVGRARYVLRKPEGRGTEEEEDESEFFISAETIDMPVEEGNGKLSEDLYGISGTDFVGRNYPTVEGQGEDDIAIPVHDACWKIFDRVSMRETGRVDIDGFVALWQREACGSCGFRGSDHDPVIKDLKEKWWVHRPGTECFAANPVDIHGFKLMMRDVYSEAPENNTVSATRVSTSQRLVPRSNKSTRRQQNDTDPFHTVPAELKNRIFAKLTAEDISKLRHSPKKFRQLPQQTLKSFIQEDMPWFWEIDDIRSDVESYYQASFTEEFGDDLDLLEGVMPAAWFKFAKERIEGAPLDVNWLQVYKQLKVMEKGSLGLMNRARIWGVVKEIVERIAGLRMELEGSKGGLSFEREEEGKCDDEEDYSCCAGCVDVQVESEDDDISEEDEAEVGSETSLEEIGSGDVSSLSEDSD